MKSTKYLLIIVLFYTTIFTLSYAQLGTCPSNLLYLHYSDGRIGQIDLTNNSHSINTINTTASGSGLAYGDVNGITPSPTFFTIRSGVIFYYNGAAWVSTGHSSGSTAAVNITAGGGYLFLLDGLAGRIYRYDGTGNAVQILTVPASPGPFDLASDIDGNFYFLKTATAPYQLIKYSPTGAILCTWAVTGMNGISSGGGFGFVGDRLYAETGGTLYTGVFTATTVNFTTSPLPGGSFSADMASCPLVTPVTSFVSATSISCTFNSLQITVSPPNILPATYQWSGPSIVGPSNAQTITVNQPGTYTVVVTPNAGCPVTKTIVVPGPSLPVVDAVMTQRVECSGVAGAATVNVSGGTSPYTYLWNTGATTTSISNLMIGTYSVTVTDANGCAITDSVNVIGDSSIIVATIAATDVNCFGGNDGSVEVTITQGAPPYTYLWNTGATTSILSGVAAGNYSVTVNDATGCERILQASVSEPPPLVVSANNNPAQICIGDSAIIFGSAQGGVGPYTYSWAPIGGNLLQQSVTPSATTSYQLNVTDAHGCVANASTTVIVNPDPVADFSIDNIVVNLDFPAIEINLLTQGLSSWGWEIDGLYFANETSLRYEFSDVGVYCIHLEVVSNQGCQDTVSRCVEVVPGYSFYIPNSFTPDDDKLNDVFIPKGNGVENFKMEIFTRWGEKIFETDSFTVGWNGKQENGNTPLPQGVYVYKIQVTDRFSKTYDYLGNVNLFR